MRPMLSTCLLAAALACPISVSAQSLVPTSNPPTPVAVDEARDAPRIQVALLLDTSNSMDGLIHQAKAQLWGMVNELARHRRNGRDAVIEVALYEYGNNDLSAQSGYIRRVVALTRDLDAVSEALFALDTHGGSEHCGEVISRAVGELAWSNSGRDARFVFIAGNEAFTQGSLDYALACKAATDKDITVNTIHCGSADEGRRGEWHLGAQLGNGEFLTIEQDRAILDIRCPQDDHILELNRKLNSTYIPYGHEGSAMLRRQEVQDGLAESVAPTTAMARVASKASSAYHNDRWDLVDAVAADRVEINEVEREQLPETLRSLDDDALLAEVERRGTERAEVQAEIKALQAEREVYLVAERKRLAGGDEGTLGDALVNVVRMRLDQVGFERVDP
ncbi:MAG: vWA domain-containing protein [Phycisphaeraceae bacterium]